jgi:O-glycosyl hydrolase
MRVREKKKFHVLVLALELDRSYVLSVFQDLVFWYLLLNTVMGIRQKACSKCLGHVHACNQRDAQQLRTEFEDSLSLYPRKGRVVLCICNQYGR